MSIYLNTSRSQNVARYNKILSASHAEFVWATIICSSSLANFPAPDSVVFLARKTYFRLHKAQKKSTAVCSFSCTCFVTPQRIEL